MCGRNGFAPILILALALVACGEMEPDEPLLTLDEAHGLWNGSHVDKLLADSGAVFEVTETDSVIEILVDCPFGGQASLEFSQSFWELADTSYSTLPSQTTYTDCKVNGAGTAEDVEFLVTGRGLASEITTGLFPDSLMATAWVHGSLDWVIEADGRSGRCDINIQAEGRWDISDVFDVTGGGVFGGLVCDHPFEKEWELMVTHIQGLVFSISGPGVRLSEGSTGVLTWTGH